MLPDTARIEEAVARLRAGGLVAFPTETVYGLGADARNPAAVAKVFALKGRPATHPLIVHVSGLAAVPDWAGEFPDAARRLAEAFWPGPLTLVLPKAAGVPAAVTGGQDSIGLRAPAHPVARALLAAFGGGIAAPSANRYGRISPTRAAHVREEFEDDVPLVLEGGDCEVGLESTIVACLGGRPLLLRPGSITRAQLEDVVGPLQQPGPGAPRAPGGDRSHYAPRTPLELVEAAGLPARLAELAAQGVGVAVLARSVGRDAAALRWRQLGPGAAAYGRGLYAALRDLDRAGAARILIESPPPGEDWAAVADRLARASAR